MIDPVTMFFGLPVSKLTTDSAIATLDANPGYSAAGWLDVPPGPLDDVLHDGRDLRLQDGTYTLGSNEFRNFEDNPKWRQIRGTGNTIIQGLGPAGPMRSRLKRVKWVGCNFLFTKDFQALGAELGAESWLDQCNITCDPVNTTFWANHFEVWGQGSQAYANWYITRCTARNTMWGFSYCALVIGCDLGPSWAYTMKGVRTAADNFVHDVASSTIAHTDPVEHTTGVDSLPRVMARIKTANCQGGMLRISSGTSGKNWLEFDGTGIQQVAGAGDPNWGGYDNNFGDGLDGPDADTTITGNFPYSRFNFNPLTVYKGIVLACGLHWANAEWLRLGNPPPGVDVSGCWQASVQHGAIANLSLAADNRTLSWTNQTPSWPDGKGNSVLRVRKRNGTVISIVKDLDPAATSTIIDTAPGDIVWIESINWGAYPATIASNFVRAPDAVPPVIPELTPKTKAVRDAVRILEPYYGIDATITQAVQILYPLINGA